MDVVTVVVGILTIILMGLNVHNKINVALGLGERLPWPVSQGAHTATGYLVARMANVNPIASVILFVVFMAYQIVDAMYVEKSWNTYLKDVAGFAVGIVAWAVQNGLWNL